MFVYNTQSKKTSPSACGESAAAKIQEERNLPRAERHLPIYSVPFRAPRFWMATQQHCLDEASVAQGTQLLTSSVWSRILQRHWAGLFHDVAEGQGARGSLVPALGTV